MPFKLKNAIHAYYMKQGCLKEKLIISLSLNLPLPIQLNQLLILSMLRVCCISFHTFLLVYTKMY